MIHSVAGLLGEGLSKRRPFRDPHHSASLPALVGGGIRIRRLMDRGGVLLVNLAKGRLGEDSSTLLGALLTTTIGLAAFSRADRMDKDRPDFHVYIDEFQSFTTLSLANMLSELRKYGVGMTLAHQHLAQLDPQIRSAVLGNVGTIICFRIGPDDAITLMPEFQPKFDVLDLINLPNHHTYVKLMVDGAPSQPFSASTQLPSRSNLASGWAA